MTPDCDLLRRYAETNSEEAFAKLVRRHLDLVYSLTGAAAAGTGISATLMKFMAMTKVKAGVAGALVIVGVATPLTIQHQSLNRMRQENLALRQQTGEITQLREANARLAKLQVDAEELERLRKGHAELMRLRGEVASLRGIKDDRNERNQSIKIPADWQRMEISDAFAC
jgi:hypothetical protein